MIVCHLERVLCGICPPCTHLQAIYDQLGVAGMRLHLNVLGVLEAYFAVCAGY